MAYADNQNSNGISYEVSTFRGWWRDSWTFFPFKLHLLGVFVVSSPVPEFFDLLKMTTTISTHVRRTKDQRTSCLLLARFWWFFVNFSAQKRNKSIKWKLNILLFNFIQILTN